MVVLPLLWASRLICLLKNYRVGGKTLLQIFTNKVYGLKQSDIYRELTTIHEFRNRIAHHEPICFNAARTIVYKSIITLYVLIYGICGLILILFWERLKSWILF